MTRQDGTGGGNECRSFGDKNKKSRTAVSGKDSAQPAASRYWGCAGECGRTAGHTGLAKACVAVGATRRRSPVHSMAPRMPRDNTRRRSDSPVILARPPFRLLAAAPLMLAIPLARPTNDYQWRAAHQNTRRSGSALPRLGCAKEAGEPTDVRIVPSSLDARARGHDVVC